MNPQLDNQALVCSQHGTAAVGYANKVAQRHRGPGINSIYPRSRIDLSLQNMSSLARRRLEECEECERIFRARLRQIEQQEAK